MNAHSRASTLPPLQSFWWYVRGEAIVVSSFTVVVGFQTTRIKGIMPKGLEVELELLGVKGTVK